MPSIDLSGIDAKALLANMGVRPDADLVRRAATELLTWDGEAFLEILEGSQAEAWTGGFFLACLGGVVREKFGRPNRALLIEEAARIAARQPVNDDDPPIPAWKVECALRVTSGESSIAHEVDHEDLLSGTGLALYDLLNDLDLDTEPDALERVLTFVLTEFETGLSILEAEARKSEAEPETP